MSQEGFSRERPLQSKKFIAFLISEIAWKIALTTVLVLGMKNSTIDMIVGSLAMGIVLVAGFIEALYIGGQAALDRYIRVADIAVRNGHGVNMRDIEIQPKEGKVIP